MKRFLILVLLLAGFVLAVRHGYFKRYLPEVVTRMLSPGAITAPGTPPPRSMPVVTRGSDSGSDNPGSSPPAAGSNNPGSSPPAAGSNNPGSTRPTHVHVPTVGHHPTGQASTCYEDVRRLTRSPSDIPLTLPSANSSTTLTPGLKALKLEAQQSGQAARWRRFADAACRDSLYSEASDAYHREALVYAKTGDCNAAEAESLKASRYASQVGIYQYRPVLSGGNRRNAPPRARLEPRSGCYVGAFIDRDDRLPRLIMEGQEYGDVSAFDRRIGKAHAAFFMYRQYGQPFPTQWVEYLKAHHAMAHIALEPRSLKQVRNDAYLKGFVEAARAANWPIFIRFASEMNGDWTSYHGDPEAYKRAFRLVYRAFRRAPKVALIWCPNAAPTYNIDAYYPGDQYTDWVGVNFYSVLYFDNDRSRPAAGVDPTDMLRYVYRKYSARKPICIAEYGASHQQKGDPRVWADFAATKIAQLYYSLPTRFPRVKMIDWYDCDNLRHAPVGRQLNDYSITDNGHVQAAYRRAVSSPYFLGAGAVNNHQAAPLEAVRLHDGDSVLHAYGIQARVKTYAMHPYIYFRLDGKVVKATRRRANAFLAVGKLSPGKHHLDVLVFDDHRRPVAKRSLVLTR